LFCLSKPYAWAIARRNRRYDSGASDVVLLDRPVISVGNITTGGTGKTPMCIWLAERLIEMGRKPAVVSRGYRAARHEINDEMQVLTHRVPAAVCVANPLRAAAAEFAIEEYGADVIVMDDGFQHRGLARDLDIVLIDATCPFGFDHVLPRGLLREPVENLVRADLFIVSHADLATPEQIRTVTARLSDLAPDLPTARCRHRITGLISLEGVISPISPMPVSRVFLTAGIGNPRPFRDSVLTFGLDVAGACWWPDHHRYREADAESIERLAGGARAQAIFTTEKDLVKLQHLAREWTVPVIALRADLDFLDEDVRTVLEQVQRVIPSSERSGHET
jgi:tetraacyldisaccharide 4'-kinase